MEYELAKKLKDAGFPQVQPHSAHEDYKDCTKPTLSELIESLPIQESTKFRLIYKHGEWQACIYDTKRHHIYKNGKTPEEAVAMLYLELNNSK